MTLAAYNFSRPARLPGDGQQRLTAWFRAALKLAARAWGKDLSFETAAELREVDIVHAREVFGKLPERVVGHSILVGPSELPTLLLWPRSLLVGVVASVLGEAADPEQTDRDLTVVEQSLAEYFLQTHWLPFFRDTWPAQNQVIWQLGAFETMPQRSRLFDGDEPVVVFTWTFTTPGGEQACQWVWRKKGLEQLLGSADAETPASNVGPRLDELVRNLPLDLVVVLGSVELRLSQLSQLRTGDLIVLNQRVSEPLTAQVGEKDKFVGWAGRTGLSKAFQIDARKDE